MIQRIQTLYLLIVVGLLSSIFFTKFGIFLSNVDTYVLFLKGVNLEGSSETIIKTLPLLVLLIIVICLTFFSIFISKRRTVQMRIVIYSIIVLIGYLGALAGYILYIKNQLLITSFKLSYTVIFPLISIIFLYMAFRGIKKDDLLVRSIDRIR